MKQPHSAQDFVFGIHIIMLITLVFFQFGQALPVAFAQGATYGSISSDLSTNTFQGNGWPVNDVVTLSKNDPSTIIQLNNVLGPGSTPGAFSKISPASGVTGVPTNLALNWGRSNKAAIYEYCIDTSNNNTCDSGWITTRTNTGASLTGLSYSTTYYWQVLATNSYGTTAANSGIWWSFTTSLVPPSPFAKISPVNGARVATNPTLTWQASAGASSYEYCYDTKIDSKCKGDQWISVGSNTTIPLADLKNNTPYEWQVRAVNQAGTTDANNNTWWVFTTLGGAQPGVFSKAYPTNGATEMPTTQTISWQASSGVASYYYCIDTSNNNSCEGGWIPTGTNTSANPPGLLNNTTYYWQVIATNQYGVTEANTNVWWSFTTQLVRPGPFSKGNPTYDATGVSINPTLTWGTSSYATGYEYCLDTTIVNPCSGNWTSTGADTFVSLSGLPYNTTFYWQVRAVNQYGVTEANSNTWWSFTTQVAPPVAFSKNYPANTSTGVPINLTLTWGSSSNAASYEYCIDTTIVNPCGGDWTSTGTNTFVSPPSLPYETTFYWQVRAINLGGETSANTDSWWSFTTQVAPPGAFSKSGPGNGANLLPINLTLTWGNSNDAASYEYCIDTIDDNECGGSWTSTGTDITANLTGLSKSTTYSWQVRAINLGGTTAADASTWWSFTTIGDLSAGKDHTCALTNAGGAKCWGYNFRGKLGDGTNIDHWTPVDVVGLTSGVTAISTGYFHTCALTSMGGVKCWGDNGNGELGNGTTTDNWTPVDVVGLSSGVVAISTGAAHTCALTSAGGVKCWGFNWAGQLGDGTNNNQRELPVDVVGLSSGVISIFAGPSHTCALTSTGGVKCWGENSNGELGNGTTTNSFTPVDVIGLDSEVIAISPGVGFTCALTSTGGVKCWGANSNGQLGTGTTNSSLIPVDVVGLDSGVTAISSRRLHTCALTSTGGVKCWGDNALGGLGDGTRDERWSPVDVVGLNSGVLAISAGEYYTCALTSTGGLKCWGDNYYGQLGDGTTTQRWTPVDVVWP